MRTTAGASSNECFRLTRQMTLEEKDPTNSKYSADMPAILSGTETYLKYNITPRACPYLLNRVDFPPSSGFRLSLCFCPLPTACGLDFIWALDTSPRKQISGAFLENKQVGFLRSGMCISRIGPNKQKLATGSESQSWNLKRAGHRVRPQASRVRLIHANILEFQVFDLNGHINVYYIILYMYV